MYKPSTNLVITNIWDLFLTKLVTKVDSNNINSVEVHPQWSNNGHHLSWWLLVHYGLEDHNLYIKSKQWLKVQVKGEQKSVTWVESLQKFD
jgi:hypothetical protein